MAYVKLYDGFTMNESHNGKNATLVYHEEGGCHDSNSTFSLPSIGDSITANPSFTDKDIYDANNWANCLCTDIRGEIVPTNDGTVYQKYTVEYSTDPAQDSYTEENLRISIEWLTIKQEGQQNALFFLTSNAVFDGIDKRVIPTADYEVTSYHDTLTGATQFSPSGGGTSSFYDIVGNVLEGGVSGTAVRPVDNVSIDWKDGYWLCVGVDIQQIVNRHGTKKWRRTENYKYRIMQVKNQVTGSSYPAGWNTAYDLNQGVFDQVIPQPYKTIPQTSWPRVMPAI